MSTKRISKNLLIYILVELEKMPQPMSHRWITCRDYRKICRELLSNSHCWFFQQHPPLNFTSRTIHLPLKCTLRMRGRPEFYLFCVTMKDCFPFCICFVINVFVLASFNTHESCSVALQYGFTDVFFSCLQVFDLLPVRSLTGYPYNVQDEPECLGFRPRLALVRDPAYTAPTNEAYTTFKVENVFCHYMDMNGVIDLICLVF